MEGADSEAVIVAAASEAVVQTYTTCFSECCYYMVCGVFQTLRLDYNTSGIFSVF